MASAGARSCGSSGADSGSAASTWDDEGPGDCGGEVFAMILVEVNVCGEEKGEDRRP